MKKLGMGHFAAIGIAIVSAILVVSFQNQSSPYAPPTNPPRLVSPDPNNYADGYWRFWGTSLGGPAINITKGNPSATLESTLRATYVKALFSDAPGALGFNMARFTIGGGYNPNFGESLTPAHFDQLGFIQDISFSTTNSSGAPVITKYRVLTQSLNRGTCDINNNPAWNTYQRISDPTPVRMYCNINTADATKNKSINLQLSDIEPCYHPDDFNSWGGGPAGFNINTESLTDDSRPGNHHERQVLLGAVSAINNSGKPVKVETESLLAPYYVMDSRCQSGHFFDFSTPPPLGQPASIYDPIDSISQVGSITSGAESFGTYIGQVVSQLNSDLKAQNPNYPAHVSDVEPYNSPIHYQSALSASGPTYTQFNGSWKISTLLSLFPSIKTSLNAVDTTVGMTGFDDDELGDINQYAQMANRLDGGTGTFFMLLQDRDSTTAPSAVLNSMDYVSAHAFTGTLVRELLAIVRDAHKPITVSGDGCCATPGTWGETQVIQQPGFGPWVYPPDANGNYPSPNADGTEPSGGHPANLYWLGADKYSYVMREMIKYMGATAWHFLSAAWGLFNVVDGVVEPQATYYAIREFMHAIPPESQLVKIDDDNMLAATYHDATGASYLSLIIYNGVFAKKPPTACPERFPCTNRPADSFAGLTTIKQQPQPLYYKIDLSQFGVSPGTQATVRVLRPDSSELEHTSTTVCRSNTNSYNLQPNPTSSSTWYYPGQDASVTAPLYYGGCNVQLSTTTVPAGAVASDLPSWPANIEVLNDDRGASTGRLGLAINVPAHAIYFIKIPLSTTPPMVPLNNMTVVDDSQFTNSTSGNWNQAHETSFQYYNDMSEVGAGKPTTDSHIYGAATYQNTYSETKVGGASMAVTFGRKGGPPARLRIFAVQRPMGGVAHLTLDYHSNSPAEYTFTTYGEYWMGHVLIYDSGELSAEPHLVRIFNYNGQTLTIDNIETSDPTSTTVELN